MKNQPRPKSKTLLAGLVVLLVLAAGFVAYQVSGMFKPAAASIAKPPDGPLWEKAYKLAEEVRQDERFKLVSVFVDHEDNKTLVFAGEVPNSNSIAELEAKLKTMSIDSEYRVQVEPLK